MSAASQQQRHAQESSHCEGIKPRQTSAWKTRAHFSFPQSTSSRLNTWPFGSHFYILNSKNSPEQCNHILLITPGQVWIWCRCFPCLVDCNNQVQHLIVRFPPAFVRFRQSFRMPGKAPAINKTRLRIGAWKCNIYKSPRCGAEGILSEIFNYFIIGN